MNPLSTPSPPTRAVIVAAACVIVLAAIQVASPIVGPMLLAAFIAVVMSPLLTWLQNKGVPKWGALALVVLVLFELGSLLVLLVGGAWEGLQRSLPAYQERLLALSANLGERLEGFGFSNASEAAQAMLDPAAAIGFARYALSNMSGLFGTGLLVLLAVIFMLAEASELRGKLRAAFAFNADAEQRLQRILQAINRYMVIKAALSLATGLSIWIWLAVLGIDFGMFWGILAFVLNFIPYVGAILMAIPAVLVALIQTDMHTALLVAGGYVVVNTVIGSLLEPRFMGRGLGISTLAVFLSLLLWGWVLGTIGALLAVPLTMVVIMVLDAYPETRPIAIMLGPDVTQETEKRAEPVRDEIQ